MTRVNLAESRPIGEAVATADVKSGRLLVNLITPGWGSSGYYSAKVLENAGRDKAFPAGTQMYMDHPSATEKQDRPERSVKDLAAVLQEDAHWDAAAQQLVAEVEVFPTYREILTDQSFAKAIGVSIRGYAEATIGSAEGRAGTIITSLVEGISADFVTNAGRGGSILQVLESARPERVVSRAVAHGVEEATANDKRRALNAAVESAYGAENTWIWVRDFDETNVWFDHESAAESVVFQQGYTIDEALKVTLAAADPVQVTVRTEYVPVVTESTDVPAPVGQINAIKENTMAFTQIDEAELGRIRQDAERVPTLLSERDTAVQERDAAVKERDELRESSVAASREGAARSVIATESTEAGVTFSALETSGLLAGMPVKEGALDEDAFRTTVKAEAARKAEESGAGRVAGFGASVTTTNPDIVKAAESAAAGAFGRTVKEA